MNPDDAEGQEPVDETLKLPIESGLGQLKRLRDQAHESDHTRYEDRGEIGRGGMGVVHQMFDRNLRRNLAMKLTLQHGLPDGSDTPSIQTEGMARFLEEARITGQLDHPGVVPVHDCGFDSEGHLFFTMRLVKGQEFSAIIKHVHDPEAGSDWNMTRALGVLLKVCEAMSFAHDKHVVHRDLKPSNVMVGAHGEVYVMDWGLARMEGREDDRNLRPQQEQEGTAEAQAHETLSPSGSALKTLDGTVLGTPFFMPPEQAEGRLGELGPRSDVYSLGAMLYHLLTGSRPYQKPGSKAGARMILAMVREGPPKSVELLSPGTSPELIAICQRAMARRPEERYADMGELAEDLRAYLEGRVVQAYQIGAWAEIRKWVLRNKAIAALFALLLTAVIGGLGGLSLVKSNFAADLGTKNDALLLAQSKELEARDEALREADLAKANAARADAKTADVLRLSLAQDCSDLLLEAPSLWPPHPHLIGPLRAWLAEADKLIAELPALISRRDELRGTAREQTPEERLADRASHADFAELQSLQAELTARRSQLAVLRGEAQIEPIQVDFSLHPARALTLNSRAWMLVKPNRTSFGQETLGLALAQRALEGAAEEDRSNVLDTIAWCYLSLGDADAALDASYMSLEDAQEQDRDEAGEDFEFLEETIAEALSLDGLAASESFLKELEAELATLEARVETRNQWSFPTETEQQTKNRWWHNQLSNLIAALQPLERDLVAADALSASHGWSIGKRLAFAEDLERGLAEGGAYREAWQAALPAINQAHAGLDLQPQMGLLPLGPDPDSGLWEFAHLQSGAPARRGADGKLILDEYTGLVLVLIPEARFWMGASTDPNAPNNFDDDAAYSESPVHEVQLSAYFISKYEMTQGQWKRANGSDPSHRSMAKRENILSNRHPVEQVSWPTCVDLLRTQGLLLPTEAQWEHACRGAQPGARSYPSAETKDYANLLDRAFHDAFESEAENAPWNDGFGNHAPVGSLKPNAFGLHDTLGNVIEWCLDGYDSDYYYGSPVMNPVAPPTNPATRLGRGGSFADLPVDARTADRYGFNENNTTDDLGLRPARAVTR